MDEKGNKALCEPIRRHTCFFIEFQKSTHLNNAPIGQSWLSIGLCRDSAEQPSFSVCLPPQVMEFYCESCETAMCLECTEGEHREHVTVPLRDVVEQHKAVLKTQLDAIRSR